MKFFATASTLFVAAGAVMAASIQERQIFGDLIPGLGGASGCQDGGQPHCCDSTAQANEIKGLLSSFGVQGVLDGMAGFNCIQVSSAAGAVQNTCKSEPVCCSNMHTSGLFGLGCSPITVN